MKTFPLFTTDPTPLHWVAWGLLVLAVAILIVAKHTTRPKGPSEVPPVEERPALPKSVRDRLATREDAQRTAHAREVHGHDQEMKP